MHARTWTYVAIAAAAALTACRANFRVNRFPTNEALYTAGLREFERKHWSNAIAAFEKLTTELPARDTLLPRSFWYLAQAHSRQREHLLAAQSFERLFESFPDDTLADDAAMEAARSYKRLWRKPPLDPTYGETALTTYNTLIGLYGESSELAEAARREIVELEQWFATKNYETGLYYFRRKAFDSANIYFTYVLARWPNVPRARDALLRLAESYRAIRYREQFVETCSKLRATSPPLRLTLRAPGRFLVRNRCDSPSSAAASILRTSATCSPPATPATSYRSIAWFSFRPRRSP